MIAANNGWHLEPYVWYAPDGATPVDWLLVAVGTVLGLWWLRRRWRESLAHDLALKEARRRQTERMIQVALARSRRAQAQGPGAGRQEPGPTIDQPRPAAGHRPDTGEEP
jgi:hypothetical protein